MAKDNLARDTRYTPQIKRACILTGGGDAPGLNAVLRAFVKTASQLGIEVYGSEDGFEGLVDEPGRIRPMPLSSVRGILPRGGSILGCSNRVNPFAHPVKDKNGEEKVVDVSQGVVDKLQKLEIDALVLVGGDGTMYYGNRLWKMGVPVIGVPKTIDNDLAATDLSFGLDTAVSTATWALDALHATAEAHDRVMILEVMGRDSGWIALYAGIAGGAHVILIPEIPYDVDRVVQKIRSRSALGHNFSMVVVGEGARPLGGTVSTLTPGREGLLPKLGGAGQQLADLIQGRVNHEVRVTVLGHLQRGGSPSAIDRILGTRFGAYAAQMCADGRVGQVAVLRGTEIIAVPIESVAGQPKRVSPQGQLVEAARAIGIELGQP